MNKISLINPSNSRYYVLTINHNLFGEYEVITSRGSHKRKSIMKYIPFASFDEAISKYKELVKLRNKHGYIENTNL